MGFLFSTGFLMFPEKSEKSEPGVVLSINENEINVILRPPAFRWERDKNLTQLSIPGFQSEVIPGSPSLPYYSVFINLPADDYDNMSIRYSKEIHLPAPDGLVINQQVDASFEAPVILEKQKIETPYPTSPIFVGESFWYRDQHLLPVTFYPLLWDSDQNEFIWYQDLQVSLKYQVEIDASTREEILTANSYDRVNTNSLTRGDDFNLETDPPVLWGGHLREPWDVRAKIVVEEDEVYQITYEDLLSLGFVTEGVNPKNLHLENQGRELAYFWEGDEDDLFEAGESILFYGEKFRGDYLAELYEKEDDHWLAYGNWQPKFSAFMLEKYTHKNVYWLFLGDRPGVRMQSQNRAPGDGEPVTTFRDTLHFEKEKVWWTYHFTNEDTWFWEYQQVSKFPSKFEYEIDLIDPVISEEFSAEIKAQIVSATASANITPDHHVRAFLNHHMFSDHVWDGAIRTSLMGEVNQTIISNGSNTFSFEVQYQGLPAVSYGFDYVDVSYRRFLKAVDDHLQFNIDQAGDIEVSNLASNENYLWNITDPLNPITINQSTFKEGSLSFSQETNEKQSYLVTNQSAVNSVSEKIVLVQPEDLLSPHQQADYLIISSAEFKENLQPLIKYRQSQGLKVKWVNLDDIYNQFNYGITHPIAIKNFFGYTYQHWQMPAPLYVLLVGDGHWDLKNLRTDEKNYLPPNFVWVDPLQGEIDSLSDLVAVVGDDNFPDALIGRMPVNTPQELDAYITKTIAFENSIGDWKKGLAFIADNYYLQDPLAYGPCIDNDAATICPTDPAGNFPELANQVIEYLYQTLYQIKKIYLDDYNCRSSSSPNCQTVTQEIINSFNQGNQIITFNGHGSINNWTSERVLHVNHIDQMANDFYPIVFSLDCVDGYWYYPQHLLGQSTDRRSLAEEITRAANKGAAAMLSSPGNGYLNGQELLQKGFFSAFATLRNPTLGELDLNAKLNLMIRHSHDSLLFTYMIFGDPALHLSTFHWSTYLPWITR